jgi:hypothetical protein
VFMETLPRHELGEALTPGAETSGTEVERTLEMLRLEQVRFLGALQQACAVLGKHSPLLGRAAATQARLTNQFFDAQRSITGRLVAAATETAGIAESADDVAARIAAGELDTSSAGTVPGFDDAIESIPRGAERSTVAVAGIAAIRTTSDAEALAGVIDDALRTSEPDGFVLQRQFAEFLDAWWSAEKREGASVVDTARARAQMTVHVARIKAGEHKANSQPTLPSPIAAILDEAPTMGLQSMLAMLADSLEAPSSTAPSMAAESNRSLSDGADVAAVGPIAPFSAPEFKRLVTTLPDGSATDLVAATAEPVDSDEAFRRFWAAESSRFTLRRTVRHGR